MNRKIIGGVVLFGAVVILGYLGVSYGYVEPARKVLPKGTATELTNPDLPKRKGVQLGDIILHSAFSTGVTIDPNIYLENIDEQYEIIYTEAGSFGLEVPFRNNKLSLDYEAIQHIFQRLPINNHLDQNVRALLNVDLTDYRVTVSDTLRSFTTLPGEQGGSRVNQDTNEARIGITRQADKFGFDAGYTNAFHTYQSDDTVFPSVTYKDRSSTKHIADMSVGYRLMPKTSLVLEDDYGISQYSSDTSPDYYFNDILVGVKEDPSKKLSANFLAGYRFQRFGESPIMYGDTVSDVVCRGGVKYALSNKDVVDATMERSVNDSVYQDNTYYTTNFLGLNYTHTFTDKVSGAAFTTYQRNKYPAPTTEGALTQKRADSAYSAGLALRYDIRQWLSVQLGYEFKKEHSNFSIFDYEDNVTWLKMAAGF